ncbi:hypothetical protein [Clostridium thermobutyricum]|uniref:Uncharacterized protein n=1 Tax=Clostridium thermobutyricum DSM 4928 TaxID=1121339 RepID=A0A1V4SWD4_9CLOT|nr:hypothetical protein [Clostridium thermobutyricum]OPX47917.1 hypothetical protein CLTHE_14880 [Clostridium thermobutyricum DSM 4928]
MNLRKDDPIYYKKKINELIQQAKENNIEITLNNNILSFAAYTDQIFLNKYGLTRQVSCKTSVDLNKVANIK